MNRELKLALIIGFSLVLLVTVLVSDHLSKARKTDLAGVESTRPLAAVDPMAHAALAAETPSGRSLGFEPGPIPMSAPAAPISSEAESVELASGESQAPGVPLVQFDQSSGRTAGPSGDAGLIETVHRLGGQVVNRDGVREILVPPAPLSATENTPGDVRHIVVNGDSLFSIAKKYYGDGSTWKRIRDANPDRVSETGVVRTGVTLKIPSSQPTVTRGPARGAPAEPERTKPRAPESKPAPRAAGGDAMAAKPGDAKVKPGTYTVRRGDTLGEIAQRVLGSTKRKTELMKLNNINDEDSIRVGAVLRLPNG